MVEELQESDLEEEPVGWHSINFLVFVIIITTSWSLSSNVGCRRHSSSHYGRHQDNLTQVRRSREVSGEPGQDSEPGYDLVTFKQN